MIQLQVTSPDGSQSSYNLTESEYIIGRDDQCNIRLVDPEISRQHARITLKGSAYWITDCNSANGTTINGERIGQETELADNTELKIANYGLKIVRSEPQKPLAILIGINGPIQNQRFELGPGPHDVGRTDDNAIVILDSSVSRKHARLMVEAGRITVENLRSSNGTFVNQAHVERCDVHPTDTLRFGSVECRIAPQTTAKTKFPNGEKAAQINSEKVVPRYLIAAALLAAIGIGGVGYTFLTSGEKAPSAPHQHESWTTAIERQLETGQNLLSQNRWQEATAAFEQVLLRDPLHAEARISLERAQTNQDQLEKVENAEALLAANQPKRALAELKHVTNSGTYASRMSDARRLATTRIAQQAAQDAEKACRRQDWKTCHQLTVTALIHNPREPQMRTLLAQSETELDRAGVVYIPWANDPLKIAMGNR